MDQYNNRYSWEEHQNRHTNPYDSRTYYEGHSQHDYRPHDSNYHQSDIETHWDRYNSASYGARNAARDQIRHEDPNADFALDDYRYRSGNREWHLTESPNPGHEERFEDRYHQQNRYTNQGRHHRDVFEWVGEGVTRMWDGVTRHHPEHHDRDYDYHRSYRDEPRSYGQNEENRRAYGHQPLRGYEKGHRFADDTPYRQQQIGDRTSPGSYNQESEFHRAGRNFDRDRNL